MKSPKTRLILGFLLAASTFTAPAVADEKQDAATLTLERILFSGEFSSKSFSARWLKDNSGFAAFKKSASEAGGRDLVRLDPETGDPTVLIPAADFVPQGAKSPLSIQGYTFSADRSMLLIYTNSKRVWRRNTRGDYWVLHRETHKLSKLGGDAKPSTLMFAKLSPNAKQAAYVLENNIYVEDLQTQKITPLTTSGSKNIINGTFDWVYEEELGLRDGFRWCPDSKSIAYWQLDSEGVNKVSLINNTDTLYPRVTEIPYPKVGQTNSACRVGVASLDSGKTRWLDVPGDSRNHYIARMDWVDADEILIQQLNRLQNTNRLILAHAATGQLKTILTEHDEAWVNIHDELNWLTDRKQFTWISERDGWRHLYLVSRNGQHVRLVTKDDYDVIRLLHVDEERELLYFTASPDNPTQQYLYRINFDGTQLTRVTPAGSTGTHSYQISPDGKLATHRASSFDTPSTTDLVRLPSHERVRVLADNKRLREKISKLNRPSTELFRVDIGDGVLLDGWCIKPPNLDPHKKYPLLIHVYGEPAGQSVRDSWGGGNYMWHLMLAQRGYVVMCFDNRGTPAPRGREWRKCVYRQVGILAPNDQAAAVRAVIKNRPYIDSDRIGSWGWSGGGSMTLNAVFKFPDLYKMGIAIAPVPNQLYYDTIYQERYMGLPKDNAENFKQGSPITFAKQLKGDLLLIHGTGDDNCHFQTMELLINELIRHNKRFTMMAYPNRTHSIHEGKNTTRHLRELMLRYLLEHLPPGPR